MTFEDVILYIVGAFGSPVIQWLKHRLNWSGGAAFVLTLVVSLLIAVVAFFFSGEALTWGTLFENISKIFMGAAIAYQALVKNY